MFSLPYVSCFPHLIGNIVIDFLLVEGMNSTKAECVDCCLLVRGLLLANELAITVPLLPMNSDLLMNVGLIVSLGLHSWGILRLVSWLIISHPVSFFDVRIRINIPM